jgi:hypothetical protein
MTFGHRATSRREQLRAEAQFYEHLTIGANLRNAGEFDVIRAVGDQFVAEGFPYLVAANQEDTGHAFHVARRKSYKVTLEPRYQHTVDTFAVEILAQFRTGQSESVIELALGVAEAGKVVKPVGREELCGAFFGAQMNERDASSSRLQFGTKPG